MSVLCLNVCRLCVPNVVRLDVCLKKFHLIKLLARVHECKNGVIFGVRFERRKADKKANLHKNNEN